MPLPFQSNSLFRHWPGRSIAAYQMGSLSCSAKGKQSGISLLLDFVYEQRVGFRETNFQKFRPDVTIVLLHKFRGCPYFVLVR